MFNSATGVRLQNGFASDHHDNTENKSLQQTDTDRMSRKPKNERCNNLPESSYGKRSKG